MGAVQEWFNSLYVQYAATLRKSAARILGSNATAEDIVQDTFIVLLIEEEKVRGYKNPGGFIMRTFRNQVGNELQRQARHKALPLGSASDVEGNVPYVLALGDALPAGLSAKEREILIMFFEQGLSYEEIAKKYKCSVEACRTRLCRAKAHVRKILMEEK